MEIILLQLFMTLGNLLGVVSMYKKKKYKMTMLFAFAAGFCFMGLINPFLLE